MVRTMGLMADPKPAPDLHIPKSESTIKVSIIDSTTRLTMPLSTMTHPTYGSFDTLTIPTWSFLLEHSSSEGSKKILFDLGFRKDWENVTPTMLKLIKESGWKVEVSKDPMDTLAEQGVDAKEIDEIIWSHYHLDHTGDPKRFPSSTALVVGPGFKEKFPRGWPYVEDSPVREDAWEGRKLKEISFPKEGGLKIGRFDAIDYFGDGSFYLLNTPGHAIGHLCGLARTTPSTFMFFGGDVAHHCGEFRPSEYLPLPDKISLNPPPTGNFDAPLKNRFPNPCLGEALLEFHRDHKPTSSFYEANPSFNADPETAEWTVDGVTEFDADDNVFVALAHDAELKEVIELYPKPANDWKEKGWSDKSRWRFVGNFGSALKSD